MCRSSAALSDMSGLTRARDLVVREAHMGPTNAILDRHACVERGVVLDPDVVSHDDAGIDVDALPKMQPLPMRTFSRTWQKSQIWVPSPISALSETTELECTDAHLRPPP